MPLIGITSGRCYAGNASLLGICDVVIATKGSNIGMGGPAMIEGGGLGIFRPEEIGPLDVQTRNGVVDVAVEDEAEAVQVAKKYLAYFQGSISEWNCADQRLLRGIIPENRLRVYDIRSVIRTMADTSSVLELRPHFGHGMITAFIRIEGHPFGIVANNPMHLAGAIDSDGSDKAARFITAVRCVRHSADLPVRHAGYHGRPRDRKDRAGASFVAVVRHRGQRHGAIFHDRFAQGIRPGRNRDGGGRIRRGGIHRRMANGRVRTDGLEGAVKLGYRNELAAISDPAERKTRFEEMVASMYQRGKALNNASHFSIDDVIDPAETRRWIAAGLRSSPKPEPRTGKKHPYIDSW